MAITPSITVRMSTTTRVAVSGPKPSLFSRLYCGKVTRREAEINKGRVVSTGGAYTGCGAPYAGGCP